MGVIIEGDAIHFPLLGNRDEGAWRGGRRLLILLHELVLFMATGLLLAVFLVGRRLGGQVNGAMETVVLRVSLLGGDQHHLLLSWVVPVVVVVVAVQALGQVLGEHNASVLLIRIVLRSLQMGSRLATVMSNGHHRGMDIVALVMTGLFTRRGIDKVLLRLWLVRLCRDVHNVTTVARIVIEFLLLLLLFLVALFLVLIGSLLVVVFLILDQSGLGRLLGWHIVRLVVLVDCLARLRCSFVMLFVLDMLFLGGGR